MSLLIPVTSMSDILRRLEISGIHEADTRQCLAESLLQGPDDRLDPEGRDVILHGWVEFDHSVGWTIEFSLEPLVD
jgi:hypothetical protein